MPWLWILTLLPHRDPCVTLASQTRLYCVVRVQPERAVILTEIQVDGSLSAAVLSTKTMAMHLVPTYHEALAAILRHGQQG